MCEPPKHAFILAPSLYAIRNIKDRFDKFTINYKTMSVVQAYYNYTDGTTDLIGVYDTERVKAHSALIRRMLATQEPTIMYEVYLDGPTTTIESLKTVLQSIHEVLQDEIYQLRITTRNLAKAINIHHAIRYLQVEPEQTKATGHLNGYVCHQLINPDEMVAIYHAYGNPYVMRPQAEGQEATTFVATSCQDQQSVVSRDLQSALLLCCSAALYAL